VVDVIRAVDHDVASGEWPAIYEKVRAAEILLIAGPIWLGDNSSVTKQVIERLYGNSHTPTTWPGWSRTPAGSPCTAISAASGTPAAVSTSRTPSTDEPWQDVRVEDDATIVARLRAGDEAMFAELLDTWSRGMLRVARAYASSDESAEDVVQDTWLGVIRGIDRFEGRSTLKTWVYRILVNTAKTQGVRESRTVLYGDADGGPTVDPARFRGPDDPYPRGWKEFPPVWPSPESEVVSGEVRDRIEAALTDLPHRQRIVITLRDIEGYSSEEVCAILDVSAANQRVLLHRARAAVRGTVGGVLQ
jgi:RNA polymerase sigma-70 factor (ECF subfamily)